MTTQQYTDEVIRCCDCKKDFVDTAQDQKWRAMRGWENKPKRCKHCRKQKRLNIERQEAQKEAHVHPYSR